LHEESTKPLVIKLIFFWTGTEGGRATQSSGIPAKPFRASRNWGYWVFSDYLHLRYLPFLLCRQKKSMLLHGVVVQHPKSQSGDPGSATLLRDVLYGMTAFCWFDFFLYASLHHFLNGLFSEAECPRTGGNI